MSDEDQRHNCGRCLIQTDTTLSLAGILFIFIFKRNSVCKGAH